MACDPPRQFDSYEDLRAHFRTIHHREPVEIPDPSGAIDMRHIL